MAQKEGCVQADSDDSAQVTAAIELSSWYIRQICPYTPPSHLRLLRAFVEVAPGVCETYPVLICPLWRPVSAVVCGSPFMPPRLSPQVVGRNNVAEIGLFAGKAPEAQGGGKFD